MIIFFPTLINDDCFVPDRVLAPKSKADFAFVLHVLSYLSGKGRAAIVCFPGIFTGAVSSKKSVSIWWTIILY
ncbi:MAG TPA: N-6 DNA methylase [Edaphocola sp.]|nr:N-6 DNA methylase [Edaphocola sp.]